MNSFLIVMSGRADFGQDLVAAGFVLTSVEERLGPLGGTVRVLHAKREGGDAPAQIRLGAFTFRRILDAFYVPFPPDPAAATALFHFVAPVYDNLVDQKRNVANMRRLLAAVGNRIHRQTSELRVLDFGCGTGLSVIANSAPAQTVALVGTDASETMLKVARARGLAVLPYRTWRRQPPGSFDGVIASYVLHCGVTDEEWSLLRRQLTDDGVLVANYHHADAASIEAVVRQAGRASLGAEVLTDSVAVWPRNPAILFRPRR